MLPFVPLLNSDLPGLPKPTHGKVRDIYDLLDNSLMVTSDRLSAFDVVLPDPVPGRGIVLNQLSVFWFNHFSQLVPNHLITTKVGEIIRQTGLKDSPKVRQQLTGRAMLVKKCRVLPVECIVRGYLTGSGWQDYQKTGMVCGIQLPDNLQLSARLSEPIFTPSTKAQAGQHDENISFERCTEIVGLKQAEQLRALSLKIYELAANFAYERGVLIADTKFEFGIDEQGNLVLIDEVLTPDSSRFWPRQGYQAGQDQPSFDKQIVRNHLTKSGWNKKPPGPKLPISIIEQTQLRYLEVFKLITGEPLHLA